MRQIHNVTPVRPQSWVEFQDQARRRRGNAFVFVGLILIVLGAIGTVMLSMSQQGASVIAASLIGYMIGVVSGIIFGLLLRRH